MILDIMGHQFCLKNVMKNSDANTVLPHYTPLFNIDPSFISSLCQGPHFQKLHSSYVIYSLNITPPLHVLKILLGPKGDDVSRGHCNYIMLVHCIIEFFCCPMKTWQFLAGLHVVLIQYGEWWMGGRLRGQNRVPFQCNFLTQIFETFQNAYGRIEDVHEGV